MPQTDSLSARVQEYVGGRRQVGDENDQLTSCLVVADAAEQLTLELSRVKLLGRSFQFEATSGLEPAMLRLAERQFDVILFDSDPFPVGETRDMEELQLLAPETPIVMVARRDEQKQVAQAMQNGVRDYLFKDPLEPEHWLRCLSSVAEISRLERALGNLSRDHITGLYNRQTFLTLAEQLLALAPRTQGVLVLHAALDSSVARLNFLEEHRLILRAAQVFQQTFRKSDILGRWGRHEFVAVIVDAALDTARILAHRLDCTLRAHNDQYPKLPEVRLHGGLTSVDLQHRMTVGELVAKAQAVGRRSRQRAERRI
ncbi:MAG: diguanylate cyclase [Gemmataceae bacterium]